MNIVREDEYKEWYSELTYKEQALVSKRLNNIIKHNHLGDVRHIGDKLYELRWANGWRVYFIRISDNMILLIGGHKNEQEKDIKKAKLIMGRYRKS